MKLTRILLGLSLALSLPTVAVAQNATANSPRVQGVPDGYGDPLQVTIVGPDGADITSTTAQKVQGTVASGATEAGNPLAIGGRADLTTPSAVTTGQRVVQWFGGYGQPILGGYINATIDGSYTSLAHLVGHTGSVAPLAVGNYYFNGTTWDRMRGDTNAQSMSKGLSATRWRYTSSTTGILSNTTTAVTIKTAGGAGVKNAIDSCQLTTTAFGTSVPLAIRDGAGGTVVWALTVPTAGFLQPVTIVFEQPLVGTANTLLEVVTTTANTSGTVTFNCQGHTEV